MNLTINGKPVQVEPEPGQMLAGLLRERLGLTGTKIGCDESECGSCTVLLDGEPVHVSGREGGRKERHDDRGAGLTIRWRFKFAAG